MCVMIPRSTLSCLKITEHPDLASHALTNPRFESLRDSGLIRQLGGRLDLKSEAAVRELLTSRAYYSNDPCAFSMYDDPMSFASDGAVSWGCGNSLTKEVGQWRLDAGEIVVTPASGAPPFRYRLLFENGQLRLEGPGDARTRWEIDPLCRHP